MKPRAGLFTQPAVKVFVCSLSASIHYQKFNRKSLFRKGPRWINVFWKKDSVMSATIKQCAIALLLVGSSGVAYASTQGTPGATSSGSVNINASVPARVRISNLADVDLTNVEPTVDAINAQSICVWSNTSTRGYRVRAQGSGTGNAFTLSSGAFPVVPYTVEWAASAGQTTGTGLTSGVDLTNLVSSATSADCSSGPSNSASLIVKIGSASLQAMPAATTFSGSLTLLVAPE